MSAADESSRSAELEAYLQQASELSEDGYWEEAYAILLEQEEGHATDVTLLCMLGAAARALGADGQAYEYFRRCLAGTPTDPVLLATAGAGLAAFDDPDAEAALRFAALTAPDLPLARLQYGSYLAREGVTETAIVELEAARALGADDATVRYELAVAYLLAGRREAGVDEFEEALALAPDDSWTRVLYGLALLDGGRTEEAAEELHRAGDARPEDTEAQIITALACAARGWSDQAWNALARAEAGGGADSTLLDEVEQAIEAGPDAAEALLCGEIAPSAMRTRLLERP